MSPKSTLNPVERIFFPRKWLDLSARTISSHPPAFLQMLSAWLRVAVRTLDCSRVVGKLVGFMQWHVSPRLGTAPLFAGSYCWMWWGDHNQALPLKILEGLATTMALAAEKWRPPAWGIFQEFDQLARPIFDGAELSHSVLSGRVICVDAAWDLCRYRVGGLMPELGARTWLPRARVMNQQQAELEGLAWAVRLAVVLGWRSVTIVTDSTTAGHQVVGLRAKTWLGKQMRVLRVPAWRLRLSGLAVRVVWCPTEIQPADPLSRLESDFHGVMVRAEQMAWFSWGRLLNYADLCTFMGASTLA